MRTASDAYFAQVVSALRLPPVEPSPVARRVREPEVWALVKKVKTVDQLAMLMDLQDAVRGALSGMDRQARWWTPSSRSTRTSLPRSSGP